MHKCLRGGCVLELKMVVKTLASDSALFTTVGSAVTLGDFSIHLENPS